MAQHKTINRRAALNKKTGAAAGAEREHKVIDRRQTGQKTTVSVPTVPAQATAPAGGGYQSPREYGSQSGFYEARVSSTRAAMEQRQGAFREAQAALEQLHTQAEEKRKRYYELTGTFEGPTAAEYEQRIENDWTNAVELYDEGRRKWQEAKDAYQPYEDAYHAAVGEYNAYMAGEQEAYGQWKSSIRGADEIREEQKALGQKRRELVNRMQYADQYGPDNEAKIQELQTYLGGVGEREKLLAEELRYSEHFRFEDLRQNADFAQKSRYVSTGQGRGLKVDPLTGQVYGSQVGDRQYEVVNRNAAAIGEQAMGDVNNEWGHLQTMTDDEIALYNYLYATAGPQGAAEYLGHLRQELTARQQEGFAGDLDRMVREGGIGGAVLASGMSTLLSPFAGLQTTLGQIGYKLAGQEIDPNAGYAVMTNTKNALRESVSGMVEEKAGPVGSFAYQTVMSMADMLMDATMGGPAALWLIGTRGFSEGVIDAKNRGLSDGQALGLGAVGGLAEVLTERIGLDEMLKLPDEWADAGFWKGLLHGAWGEAKEEGLTNIVNLAADLAIAGEESEFMRTVRENMEQKTMPDGSIQTGMTKAEATKAAVIDALKSFGLDALGGALSGGVFGGYRGWRGKRAANMQQNKETAANAAAAEKNEDGEYTGFVEDGEDPGAESGMAPAENEGMPKDTGFVEDGEDPGAESGMAPAENEGMPKDTGEAAPSVSEADSSPIPGGTGEPVREAVNENGGNDNGENKPEAGTGVSDGDGKRRTGAGAGEPSFGLDNTPEGRRQRSQQQDQTAGRRAGNAHNSERLGQTRQVSVRELGISTGSQNDFLIEIPREQWDEEMLAVAHRTEVGTGKKVRYVDRPIAVLDRNGEKRYVAGVVEDGQIVIDATHSRWTVEQIADHEEYHVKARMLRDQGLNTKVRQCIVDTVGEDRLRETVQAYTDRLGWMNNISEDVSDEEMERLAAKAEAEILEELLADAYAGINRFEGHAEEFEAAVNAWMDEQWIGKGMRDTAAQAADAAARKEAEPPGGSASDATANVGSDAKYLEDDTDTQELYIGKNLSENAELYSYAFLTSLPDMKVVTLPDVSIVRSHNGKINQADVAAMGIENALSVGTERAGKVYAANRYTGHDIWVTTSSVRHGLNGTANRLLTNARLGAVIGEIVQNAVPINALYNTADGVVGAYAMAGYAADHQGREFVSIVTVEQRTNTVEGIEVFDVAHAISGRQKRSSRSDMKSQGSYPTPTASGRGSQADTKSQGVNPIKTPSEISIADLLVSVKDVYQSILSEDVLAELGETRNPEGYYAERVKYLEDDSEGNYADRRTGFVKDASENLNVHEGEKVAQFIDTVNAMIDSSARSKRKLKIGIISENHALLIEQLLQTIRPGISLKGYELWIDGTGARHIELRHGKHGKQDQTMASKEAKKLIPWAAQEADECEFILDNKGNIKWSDRFLNADGTRAPEISMKKQVDEGLIFVSECVPDSSNKRIWITSAYIKKGSTGQKLNMEDTSPQLTPEASFDSSATTNTVAEAWDGVKYLEDDSEGNYADGKPADDPLTREDYDRLMAEVTGDQAKRNTAFIKSKLTAEQFKQFRQFQKEDRMDEEADARLRSMERFENAVEKEELRVLRAQQAEDRARNRLELKAEETAAAKKVRELRETARKERREKAKQKKEQIRKEAQDRIRQAAQNAPQNSEPVMARKDLQDKLIGLFHVGDGQRTELKNMIGELADRMLAEGYVDEPDLRKLINRLYESGVMEIEPEEIFAEGRSYIKDEHIYISPEQIRELGDDWLTLKKKAWGLRVYLTTDRQYAGLDVWNAELAENLPGLFHAEETNDRTILDRILQIAEEGRVERMSLPEYTKMIARQEHQSEAALLEGMERQVEEALRTFAEKARLEIRLKNRNARRRAMDREEAAIHRETERIDNERRRLDLADDREALRQRNAAEQEKLDRQRAENDRRNTAERRRLAEERAARRRKAEEAKRRKEVRELQEKTLKALKWISKNRRKAPEVMQEAIKEVLGNIDLIAISTADENRWSSKYGATWKDLRQMYLHAMESDPNFIPSDDLKKIMDRLESVQLESLTVEQLRDLYQAAVGLRTEFYNRRNVIGHEEYELMQELYSDCVEEMRKAPKKRLGLPDRFFSLEQLTPMNIFQQMGGWNPNGALYRFAKQLEAGEKKVRSFKVRSQKLLTDFLEEHEDWVRTADGQGKDGKWYEVEIPELIAMQVGEVPQFGGTVKVSMTPMQKVHLFLESRNYDNLRHMTGGRTFPDRELYSKGKREEAFGKGTTIRMAPETVKLLVKDLTPEELELARLLDRYYNDLARTEINKVSNVLLGYDKAMGGTYAPIYTNQNYTRKEPGKHDGTAEGAGSLKERVVSKLPSYNISALEAFERNMEQTSIYVGMAIPVRNWNNLMNWRTENSSFTDEIDHQWGVERKKYIQELIKDLQNPGGEKQDLVAQAAGKLQSSYISSVFGFNPSIVVKQLGSLPMASAYLGWKYFPVKGTIGKGKINRDLIGRYTQELDWRTLGYSMPETRQLKDKPNWSQKNKAVGLLFGGDAITAMDGWAASVLWPWAENKVRAEYPGLEVGDAAMIESGQSPFYRKVAEVFDDAVSRSQSVSDQMHQGRLRRSKNPITRTFTMFRSDSAQSYNVLRQRLGELDYYKRQGDGDAQLAKAARKSVGAAAAAVLINSLWGTSVDLLVKLLKGKLDEEDREPEEVAEDFFWGVVNSSASMSIGGDILADLVGGWFTGEQRYGNEAPGLEQLEDILEAADKVIHAGEKGNFVGAIKIAAETLASMGYGLPMKNVESYLKGLFHWTMPGVEVAYEDLLAAPDKAGLKGLTGDALQVRLEHVMQGYGVELEEPVVAALAALYEAGYPDAVAGGAPDTVKVGGIEVELSRRMKKLYNQARADVLNQELAAVLGSAFFAEADQETQTRMVKRLYDYAGEKAKKQIFPDCEVSDSLTEYAEVAEAGGSIAECIIFKTVTGEINGEPAMKNYMKADLLREWDAEDGVKELMFRHLISDSYDEEIVKLRDAGVSFDQFLEVYAKHGEIDAKELDATTKATEFAYWLDAQRYSSGQKSSIKYEMVFMDFTPAQADRYNTATEAGLNREDALELTEKLNGLEPPEGKTSIQQIQKWRVAIDDAWDEESQLQRLKAVNMEESAYAKCEALWSQGVAPAAYVRAQEIKSQFDADGNGSLKNEDWRDLINSMVPSGIALPGDTEHFNMTNEQMGFLWQMLTGSKSTKNNPFSKSGGEKWLDMKEEMKEKEKEE